MTTSLVGSAGGLQFNLSWDASVSGASPSFKTAVMQAAQILSGYVKTPVYVNLQVGWGEVAGASVGSGAEYWSEVLNPYLTNSLFNSYTNLTQAQAQALGYLSATNGSKLWDGSIGFSAIDPWAFTDAAGVAASSSDIIGAALHELTHALGRLEGNTTLTNFTLSVGTYNDTQVNGFSIDKGKTFLQLFSPVSDTGDWLSARNSLANKVSLQSSAGTSINYASAFGVDMADAYITPGAAVNTLSFADLVELSVLGYQINSSAVSMSSAYFSYVIDDIQSQKALVSQIQLTDSGAIAITANQLASDGDALNAILGNYTLSVGAMSASSVPANGSNSHITSMTISDSSLNIAIYLDSLQSYLSKISGITQLGTIAPLSITSSQLMNDAGALNAIVGPYSLMVSGVTAASVMSDAANTKIASMTVSDSAANLQNYLAALQTNLNKISAITVSDHASLTISPAILSSDAGVLALIQAGGGSYSILQNISSPISLPSGTTYAAQPNQSITGSSGIETVTFNEAYSNFAVTISGSSATVNDQVGSYGSDSLNNIQRVQFTNGTLALDIGAGQDGGEIYRLYQAAFARTPDTGGLKYQVNALEGTGLSLYQVASNFLASPEFASKYGANPTDTQYITALYKNVLNRTPAASEVAWYQNQFNTHAMDHQAALIGFSESPENVALVGSAIANGIWLG